MSVVVTPAASSPVLDSFDVVSVVPDPAESVATWRTSDAAVLVVDSTDGTLVETIRDAPDGATVPLVLVTNDDSTGAPADAILRPDDSPETATERFEDAVAARDYRLAVSELYDACQGRSAGQPDDDVRELRAAADSAFEELAEVPPSVFHDVP